jgi:predicted nuclease of predicted toxin-antitoxin system
LNILIDENMPRSLAPQLSELGFNVQDVRDIGLRGQPDTEVMAIAVEQDAIIITKDRGFTNTKSWDENFTVGVIFINLPDDTSSRVVNARIVELLTQRLSESLLGAITSVELRRALSQTVRRRP